MAPLQLDLGILIILKRCHNCQLSIVNCQFVEAAKQQFTNSLLDWWYNYCFPARERATRRVTLAQRWAAMRSKVG